MSVKVAFALGYHAVRISGDIDPAIGMSAGKEICSHLFLQAFEIDGQTVKISRLRKNRG